MKRNLLALVLVFIGLTSMQAQKFAYVDTKYILLHVPEYSAAKAELNKLSSDWQEDIEAKYESISRLEQAFAAEKVLLTEEMKRKREQEIQAKKEEARNMQKQKFGVNGELFSKREELIKPIQEQMYEAIKDVASEKGYMVVFDKSTQSNMLYTNSKYDVSDRVIKKMGLTPGDTIEEEESGAETPAQTGAERGATQPGGTTQPGARGETGGRK